jgi:hypothetical protein
MAISNLNSKEKSITRLANNYAPSKTKCCNFLKSSNADSKIMDSTNAKGIFKHMLSNPALKKAQVYLNEEQSILEKLVCNISQPCKMNFCVVGGGAFHYLPLAAHYFSKYVIIEPYLRCFVDKEHLMVIRKLTNIKCIEASFEDYCQKHSSVFSMTKTVYIFWFNVISYIQNPIAWLNKIVKSGDIIFISKWGNTEKAQKTLKDYFNCVNNMEGRKAYKVLPTSQDIPFHQLCYNSAIQFVRQSITDIVIVHV